MSITQGFFRLLIDARKKGLIQGESILQLGRQSAFFTFAEAIKWLKEAGISFPNITPEPAFDIGFRKNNCINDVTLFSLLGFTTVHSLDISNYEGATYIQDLNMPILGKVRQQYDVIYDGGTLEHVFSTLQALQNIHAYLKVGGTVVHVNPAHNHLDHGFYSFSPQMYHDYYSINCYQIVDSYILEAFKNGYERFNAYRYKPGKLELLQFGGYGKEMLCGWFMARKQNSSTSDQIPQQGCSRSDLPHQAPHTEPLSRLVRMKTLLKQSSTLHFFVKCAKRATSFIVSHGRNSWKKINPVGAGSKLELVKRY